MTLGTYYAGWSTVETPMTMAVSGSTFGQHTITIPDGFYAHVELGSGGIIGGAYYEYFASTLQTQLDAATAGFTVTFSQTTFKYTISKSGGSTFRLIFSGDGGTNLASAMGFAATTVAATSQTSDIRPYYMIVPAISARSNVSNEYEPDDIVEESVSDGGVAYAMSKDTDELLADWTQQMEPLEAVLLRNATPSVPWTWQHFFKHCRGTHPFYVEDSENRVYKLRAEGASFSMENRTKVTADLLTQWNISLKTRVFSDIV